MTAHYDPRFVAMSIAIAIMASYVALDVMGRVSAPSGHAGWWWLCGPIAMGVGIWSMHFVGMLAFHLGVPLAYDVPTTLLSCHTGRPAFHVGIATASAAQLATGMWPRHSAENEPAP